MSQLTSVLVAEVGEPPDISQPHRVSQAGEEEVALIVPVPPLHLLLLRLGDRHQHPGQAWVIVEVKWLTFTILLLDRFVLIPFRQEIFEM